VSCRVMAWKGSGTASEKSFRRHETVMAFRYQVVYYHRQLDSGKS
jgi:hypothetical protein